MNTLIAGLLALLTLGGSAAFAADAHSALALAAAEPSCTDVAGQADVCTDVAADPASGVAADVTADVHPTPPAARPAAEPTCQDLAGHGSACVEADPASGVTVAVVVNG